MTVIKNSSGDYFPRINDVNIKEEIEETQKLIDICKEGLYETTLIPKNILDNHGRNSK